MLKQVDAKGIGKDAMYMGRTFGMGRDKTSGDPFLWIELAGEGGLSIIAVVPATPDEIVEMTRLFKKRGN